MNVQRAAPKGCCRTLARSESVISVRMCRLNVRTFSTFGICGLWVSEIAVIGGWTA
jgi:hypothetical protein